MNEQALRALALCGIEAPVYQAGLGGVAGPDLAAAVSEAGGLGHAGQGVDRIREILGAGEIVQRLMRRNPGA